VPGARERKQTARAQVQTSNQPQGNLFKDPRNTVGPKTSDKRNASANQAVVVNSATTKKLRRQPPPKQKAYVRA